MAEAVMEKPLTRLEELCNEAERKWPASSLVDALSNLHHEIVRKLMRAMREGDEVRWFAIDLQILADECRRLQQPLDDRRESGATQHRQVSKPNHFDHRQIF